VALLPLILVTMIGSMKSGTFLAAAGAFAIASLLASLFAAFAVIAVHGLLVTLVPRSRLVAFSGAVRSLLIGVLVLSLPFIGRLPASAPAFASNAWWLHWAPPAWFVGLERWLIGDAARRSLGVEALAATGLVLVISVVSYVVIYRRFDRVTLTMSHAGSARPSRRWSSRHRADGRGDVRAAVREFVWITVRRSLLHQGLVVGLLAAAGGFVANSLLSARAWHVPAGQQAQHTLVATLTWAQAALMFLAAPAVRLALSVPIELRANWVFRVTEDVRTQTEAISAGVRTVLRLAVALPIALLFPLHWRVLGSSAVPLAALAALIGWLYVELVMSGWRRIPFACTYVPGKGFVPHMFVKGVAGFILFTWICGNVLHFSVVFPRAAPIFMALAGLPALALCLRRVRRPPVLGLTFEDEIPADVTPLRLSD
jgi:hypothetical protein